MSGGPDGVTVRDARPEDGEAVRRITLAAYAEYGDVMEPAAWAGLDGAVRAALESAVPAQRMVAEVDGLVVGSVMLFPPAVDAYGGAAAAVGWPELRLLAVDHAARGRGVGRALVRECVRRARGMGAGALGLHTSGSMRAAIRMYRAMGFVRAPEHDFRPPGAELVTAYILALDS